MQIIVKLTTECNLRCVYCSEGDKAPARLPLRLLKKLIDDYPELLDKCDDKEASLLWHGGEPLLVGKEYLEEAMAYAEEKLKDYDVRFSLQTNGTLIDDEWIELFKRYQVGVGVSIDGYKELHDSKRLDKAGQPTFDRVRDNIRRLREAKVDGGCLMVWSEPEISDIDKLLVLIQDKDIHLKINPLVACGRAQNDAKAAEIGKSWAALMKMLMEKAAEENFSISPLEETVQALLTGGTLSECTYNGHCGEKMLCLFADGTMSFCGRAGGLKDIYGFGNLRDKTLWEMYNSPAAIKIRDRQKALRENDCRECKEWSLCHGGCSFEAVNANGNLNSRFPGCAARKEFLTYLKTEGLSLIKQGLLKEKHYQRTVIKEKERILEEISHAGK